MFGRLQLLAFCLGDGMEASALRKMLSAETEWSAFALLASRQLVSPAILSELRRRQLLDALPEDFRAYLEGLHELNRQRNEEIFEQLKAVVAVLNSLEIEPVLLKGCAMLATDFYPDRGSRIISDLDVLVPANLIPAASKALQQCGYQRISNPRRDAELYDSVHHHDAPLVHPQLPASVELHRRKVMSARGQQLFGLLDEATVAVSVGGGKARIQGPTHLLAHNFLHQMVQDSAYIRGTLTLRQLFEGALLVHRYREQINWAALLDAVPRSRCENEWGAYVISLRLFGVAVPYGAADPIASRLWFGRVRLQYRWPQLWRFNQWAYWRLRRVVPRWIQQRLGWGDHGWLLLKDEPDSTRQAAETRSDH